MANRKGSRLRRVKRSDYATRTVSYGVLDCGHIFARMGYYVEGHRVFCSWPPCLRG